MKPYPKYKDSRIEWLGKVPEGWETLKLKYVSDVIMGQSPSSDDYSDDSEMLPFLQGNADFTARYPIPRVYCDSANKRIPKGSILVSVRAPVGALNEADQNYGIGRGLCALIPKTDLIKEYTWYQLHVTRMELDSLATGSTYDAVSVDEIADITVLVPQIETQQAIASFLNRETARIDALIQKKERMIELLKGKRIALITQAVTKGLDPNVPMKDSGIDWLGEVPEHWEVKRFDYVCILQRGFDLPHESFVDGDYPVMGSNGVIGYHDRYTTQAPNITVGRSGSVGKVNYIESEFWAHNTALFVLCSKNNCVKWLYYLLLNIDIPRPLHIITRK